MSRASHEPMPSRAQAFLVAAACALVGGCGASEGAKAAPLVLGVTSDLAAGTEVARLHVVVRADGKPAMDVVVAGGDLAFPLALWTPILPDGSNVEVHVDAFGSHYNDVTPVLVRDLATRVDANRTALVRLHLERDCVPAAILAGGATAPTCDAKTTCVAAACVDPFVDPASLEPFRADWAERWADECRTGDAGAPEVELGLGKAGFTKLAPGDPVTLELGPQGGHHAWIAVRTRGVHRFGATMTVSARDTTAGIDLLPFDANHTLTVGGGGACELDGLRYQVLDQDNVDRVDLVGDTLELRVDVTDEDGAVTKTVVPVVLD